MFLLSMFVAAAKLLGVIRPKLRRWHVVLLAFAPVLVVVLVNTGLVALIWNRLGLHRLFRARPLSSRGCVIAGVILLCVGL